MLSDFRLRRPTIEEPQQLKAHFENILTTYFSADPKANIVRALLRNVFDGNDTVIDMAALSGTEIPYALNIFAMREHIEARMLLTDRIQMRASDQHLDFIIDDISAWPLLKVINFALLLAIPSRRRIAIVASIRNEGISILEWIAHHRSLGIDDIFIYTNNNTDCSTELLRILAQSDIIQLIDNTVGPDVPPQVKAYEHSTHFLAALRDFEWVFYLDADEFFIPRCEPGLAIDDFFIKFFGQFSHDPPSAIAFNWKWFGSENAFEKEDGLLLNRFEHSIHNRHVKSLVKTNAVLSMKPLHCPIMFRGCRTVDSQFNHLEPITTQTDPVYGTGQINHYWNKSFQEFIIKKFRGRGAVGSKDSQRDFSSFFDWGTNGTRGNYDPPPQRVVNRTQREYTKLLAIPGVGDELTAIRSAFENTIAKIDEKLDLKMIYKKFGRN